MDEEINVSVINLSCYHVDSGLLYPFFIIIVIIIIYYYYYFYY